MRQLTPNLVSKRDRDFPLNYDMSLILEISDKISSFTCISCDFHCLDSFNHHICSDKHCGFLVGVIFRVLRNVSFFANIFPVKSI